MRESRVQVMIEVALSIALALVLGWLRPFRMPFGGSIALDMLPIMVVAVRRGLMPGLTAGVLYGLVNLMLDPYVIHPAQFVLDYPLAFAAVGLAGLWAPAWRRAALASRLARAVWTIALPALVAGAAARFLAHWVSGIVFFAENAPSGQPVWLYSLIYNGTYWLPSLAGCLVAGLAVLPILERVTPSVARGLAVPSAGPTGDAEG